MDTNNALSTISLAYCSAVREALRSSDLSGTTPEALAPVLREQVKLDIERFLDYSREAIAVGATEDALRYSMAAWAIVTAHVALDLARA